MDANGKPKKSKGMQPDYDRLVSAARTAMKVLETYRANRREMVREYAGARWSENAARRPVPLNLLSLYVQIVGRSMISQNPRFNISTFDRAKKADVSKMEMWVNNRVEEMDLSDSLRRGVVDALFGMGVMKVALARPDDAMSSGWTIKAGMPFAEPVSLDDLLLDTYATRFSDMTWVANRYRMPRVAAEERFGKARAGDLDDSVPRIYNPTGDERISMLGRGLYGEDQEFEPQVTLWEFYLPAYRKVVTLAEDSVGNATTNIGDAGSSKPLEEIEWLGPDCGPYHYLAPDIVPGNLLPKGPIMDLFDLHDAVNVLLRKGIRQATRQKEVWAIGNQGAEDGQRFIDAPDGQGINCNSPDQVKPIVTTGAHPGNFNFMLQLKEMFSWAGGNLDLMGGLSPQSKTAAQDKMLNENSSRALANLQEQTVKFTASVGKSLCWYWWNHPQLRMETEYSPPGLPDISTVRVLTPENRRKTSYASMNIKVDPYSLVYATPQQKAGAVNQIVTQVITPLMPLLAPQGVGFDAHAYIDLLSRYMDLPELADVIVFQEPAQTTGGGHDQGGGMPQSSNRTYTRENVSGTSTQGNDAAMANAMSGTDAGGAQVPTLGVA